MMTSTTSKSEAPLLEHTSKCRVYVGNLDWEITWRDLKDHMRVIGHIRRADVMEDSNGRSRGFGIVEFNNEHDAMRAIAELNDTVLKSRRIFVREDRDLSKKAPLTKVHKVVEKKAPAGPREFDFSKVVIVSNLVPEIAWQDLKDQFRPAGAITRADIISGEDGVSTGVGIVEFRSANDVSNAVSLFNDSVFRENIVVVRPATAEDEFIKGKAPGHGRRVYVGQLAWSVAWQVSGSFICKLCSCH